MDVKKLVLLIGALVVAAVTAVLAKNMFAGASAPTAAAKPVVPAGPEVLVATRALPVGTIIDAEALRFQIWPKGLVQPAYYLKGQPGTNPADLIGTVVRNEVTAGQPLTQGALIRPGDRGFLAAALGPGMRAVTVALSPTSGVAGFVFPGDRVDMVLTHEVKGGGDGPPLKVSETIIRNVRVLATDQRTNVAGEDGKPVVATFRTVTLEATPKIAEKIMVAQTVGQISLTLRSLADSTADLERAIASGEVNVPGDAAGERRMLVQVANRPTDDNPSNTVGAEVSRYQRATVPGRPNKERQEEADRAARRKWEMSLRGQEATGPVVRVARGNQVTVVPVGSK